MTTLRVILGDQLSSSISALQGARPESDLVLMCEVVDETTYVPHHKKKIALILSAMRSFADTLREHGFCVRYTRLDDPRNTGSFDTEVARAVQETPHIERVIVTFPGEFRVLESIKRWQHLCQRPVEIRDDTRFLCSPAEFARWALGRKNLRMEFFYREMRKKHSILMDHQLPEGGQWNYDAQNRKPPEQGLAIPPPFRAAPTQHTNEVLALVAERFAGHFGQLEPFHFATTRTDALAALHHFIKQRLPMFGDYQDAMLEGEPWMFHAHLSFYLNCGLLEPRECLDAAEKAYRSGQAPLNAVEGFVRQILGWREYVRGIYWLRMPEYKTLNFLEAHNPLPTFYWDARTGMNCLRQCVRDTQTYAYAHHIQRLMVLGNFALIAGIDPSFVNDWFLIVYADAYEWVELPNVTGMILFADGGYLGSKPYAAGGAYIDRMSNYCTGCRYSVAEKTGPHACPFNYLYWDFLDRHREKLGNNPRLGMMYAAFDRMKTDQQTRIRESARSFLEHLNTHGTDPFAPPKDVPAP